jgi:uncharacterized ferritin-like protein (DUF455 family)
MSGIGYFELEGLRLRDDPAREGCFRVVRRDGEMDDIEGSGPLARRELVHRHMSNEVTSLDIAAQCLADFPDAPWELRLELARQCWDESRHVQVLHRKLRAMGGRKGEFPISAFEWNVTCALDDLAGRLATQNRTFEAGAMDVVGGLAPALRGADPEIAEILEGILADEIQHVRFANQWIRRLVSEDKRQLFKVAHAVRFLAEVNDAFAQVADGLNASGQPMIDHVGKVAPINVADRIEADFSEAEVAEILRQSGFPALVPEREAAT